MARALDHAVVLLARGFDEAGHEIGRQLKPVPWNFAFPNPQSLGGIRGVESITGTGNGRITHMGNIAT
jgi:hypothetical protein